MSKSYSSQADRSQDSTSALSVMPTASSGGPGLLRLSGGFQCLASDVFDDRLGDDLWVLVLPKTQDCPAGTSQSFVVALISADIARDLEVPIRPVRCWPGPMGRTGVPEAA